MKHASNPSPERVSEDFTERKQAEEQLRESEERLRGIFTQTLAGIAETDLTGRFVQVNARYCEIVGRTAEKLYGLQMQDITHPDDLTRNLPLFKRAVIEGVPFTIEKRYVRPDGSLVWVSNSVSLVRDKNGAPKHIAAVSLDITDRKQAEEALRYSERDLNDFFETASIGLHWVGPDGIILRVNQTELDMLGYTREEYLGRHIAEFHADQPVIEDVLARLTRGETLREHPARLRCKDGSIRDVLINSSVLFEKGQFIHTRCFTTDVTERRRAEQALAIRTRQQRAVAALGQFALSEPELQNVFDEAVRSVADTLGNEYCKVLELLPGGARVLLVSGVGWKQGLVGKATVPTDLDSQAGYTLVTEGPVISRDLRTETRFRGPQLLIDHGVISGMSCIIAGAAGKPWGVLGTHTTKERQFTEDDVNFLLAVANVVSNAIRRSQQEEEVRRSEERFRRLVEGAPFGMYIVDSQFRIAHMNARAQAGAFINVRPVIGRSFEEAMRILWPEDVAQQIIGVFRHTLETGEPYYSKDFVNPRADKQQVEGYEWELQRLTLPHGSFGVICYYYDSSELRLAEKALRESEERFRAMADNIDQLAWICAHPLGDVTWYNKRWLEYTGLSFEQTKGWEWSKVQHPDHLDRVVARVKQSAETGEPWEDTFPLRGKDGQYRWFLSRAVPIRDEQGNIVQWFGTNTDVTEQRAAEEALREAHELLADKAKHLDALVQQRTAKLQNAIGELEAFSYSVAHDLRAPLRAMAGYAGVLLEDTAAKLDREERTYLQRIQRAAARLDRLTQEVLTYSKISRGEIKLEHVDLDKLTHEIVEQYPGLSACRDYIEIRSPLLPVVGHESLLTQALSNLLNNACKFVTLDGTPKVVVWTEAVEGDVRIWVEDNGIGIAPEHRSRVFQMFGRIHPDDKYEGTGIGLAVAKRATERMGGTVGFESELGKGSRFWVQLQQG